MLLHSATGSQLVQKEPCVQQVSLIGPPQANLEACQHGAHVDGTELTAHVVQRKCARPLWFLVFPDSGERAPSLPIQTADKRHKHPSSRCGGPSWQRGSHAATATCLEVTLDGLESFRKTDITSLLID